MGYRAIRIGILLALTVLGVSLRAETAKLLKFVPAEVEYLVAVDAKKARAWLSSRETLENQRAIISQLSEFEKVFNLSLDDCRQILFFGVNKAMRGILVDTSLTEEKLFSSLPQDRYRAEVVEGRKIYHIIADNSKFKSLSKPVLCYLDAESILITEEIYLAEFLAGVKTNFDINSLGLDVPSGTPEVWGFLNFRSLVVSNRQKIPFLRGVLGDLHYVVWKLTSADEQSKEFILSAIGICRNKQSAALLNISLPGYLAAMANLFFANNSALSWQLMNSFKSRVEGKKVYAELKLSEEILFTTGRRTVRKANRNLRPARSVAAD